MKKTQGEKIFDVINVFIMIVIMFIMLYPFWNTIIVSFNDALDSIKGSLYFWPRKFSLYNYQSIFKDDAIFRSLRVSVMRTVIVTVLSVLVSGLFAYVLSRKTFVLRGFLTGFMVLTMYVSAGIIPVYFLFKDLGLLNNFLVYVIPGLISAFNVVVLRTYINTLPESLVESAKIDGANELKIYFFIIFPMSMPVLATIALWVAVGNWNDWFTTFIFARTPRLHTLQYKMMEVLSSAMQQGSSQQPPAPGERRDAVTPNSLRAAMTIVATVPILIVYPFLQKYFVTVNIGSVKE
jgi:putative aldouronate transport system permease protein